MSSTTWIILAAIAVILLIIYFRSRNAVWGGLTIGVVIGLIVAIIYVFIGRGFNWSIIGKIAISGTILGFIAEILPRAFNFLRGGKK